MRWITPEIPVYVCAEITAFGFPCTVLCSKSVAGLHLPWFDKYSCV